MRCGRSVSTGPLGPWSKPTLHFCGPRLAPSLVQRFARSCLQVRDFDSNYTQMVFWRGTCAYFNDSVLHVAGALMGLQRATALPGRVTTKCPGQRAGSLTG